MWREFGRFFPPLFLLVLLGACSSIAKGVTEAVLERSEREDTRQCHIEGPPTTGLSSLLDAQTRGDGDASRELKVLMIHGIGRHSPGYSGRLTENLMPALGLTHKSESRKEFVLWEHEVSDKPVGTLTAHLYMSPDRSRRLVFYELTWSEVFEEERRAIAFDNSKEYAFRRTQLNNYLKRFFNDNIPDVFIYLSEAREKIFASVQQSHCWMTSGDWNDLPNFISETCHLADRDRVRYVIQDDLVFLTHSLGSRIAIDVMQDETEVVRRPQIYPQEIKDAFRDTEVRIYMLANQLPLIGLSIKPPLVQEQTQDYCAPGGKLVDQRGLKKLNIYTFNDPNDLLSYPIPPHLVGRYVNSRMCPSVTNISINVTQPIDLFGLSQVANPAAAHADYDQDERVMEIIARGVGQENESKLVKDGCTWVRTAAP